MFIDDKENLGAEFNQPIEKNSTLKLILNQSTIKAFQKLVILTTFTIFLLKSIASSDLFARVTRCLTHTLIHKTQIKYQIQF